MNGFTIQEINTAIESMAKAQSGAFKAIGKVLVMALWHANEGPADPKNPGVFTPSADTANALLKNLRKSTKKDALIAVMEQLGNLAYASGAFVHYPEARRGWTEDEVKAAKVAASDWENFKAAPAAAKPVDLIEAFDELVDKLAKKASKNELVHAESLIRLRGLLGELKGQQLLAD